MATNIDKTLFPAPQGGLPEDAPEDAALTLPDEATIEVEIVDPEGEEDVADSEEPAQDFDANLVELLDEAELQTLASDLLTDIDNDKQSRKDWEETYVEGLKLLGLKYEDRTEPWAGACGVFHPMITEAVVRFQSETITETFPAKGPVKTKILGKETPDKREAAVRVEEDMNYQLVDRMVEFRPEHEKMLWSLPATGSAFKKVYFDPSLGRQVSVFLPAEDVLLPYGVSDIYSAPRVTHVMRKTKNELLKLQAAGFYADIDLPEPVKSSDDIRKAKDEETGFSDINDERYTLYESHVELNVKIDDEDETGIQLPYVMTVIKDSEVVLGLRRNWKEDDALKLKRQHFVHYQYVPGFGAYGYGLFHLIGGFAKSATSLMRQLVDAGTLSNLPGGLKARGLRIKGDDTPIAPGEFRDVDVSSGTIRDNILPMPYKEPSATLFNLLNTIVEEGRRFASTADMKVSDMSAQAPVGTTLALLERQLKVLTAVQARVHYSLKQELRLLAAIIRDYSDDSYDYQPETATPRAKKEDYSHVDILPVSDPNAATLSQRIIQYQAAIQMAQMAPDIYDMPQLHRGMLAVLGIKDADKLVPLEEDMKPVDPVTENMAILNCKPVKAFLYQDHESHIQVHMAMAQDPLVTQMVGQSPKASQIMAAAAAHITEHVAFAYRQRIEQQMGVALPPEDEKLPPEVEVALSGMMAQAAQGVLQQSKQNQAQQQAQQQAQDPLVQLQMKETQLEEKKVAIKEKEVDGNLALEKEKIDLQREKMAADNEHKGFVAGTQARQADARLEAEQNAKGVQMGIDIARAHHDKATQQLPKGNS